MVFQQSRTLYSVYVGVSTRAFEKTIVISLLALRKLEGTAAITSLPPPVALADTPCTHPSSCRTGMRLEWKCPSWRLIAGKKRGKSQGAAGDLLFPCVQGWCSQPRAEEIWMERGQQSPPGKMSTKRSPLMWHVPCHWGQGRHASITEMILHTCDTRGEHILFSKLYKIQYSNLFIQT